MMANRVASLARRAWERIKPFAPTILMVGLFLLNVSVGHAEPAATQESVNEIVSTIKTWIVRFAGSIALVIGLISGVQMMLAGAGNPQLYQQAKDRLRYAVVGLLVVGFVNVIVNAVLEFVKDSSGAEITVPTP